jgi:hypothetical protein
MRHTPREEFLPLFGCEGFVVVFLPTASTISLPFNVVGKADAERLVWNRGSRKQVRGIEGAHGGWGVVDEAVKEIPNNPNGKQAKTAEVLFQVIRVSKSGILSVATSGWSRGRDTSCQGLACRRRGTQQNGGRRRGSQAEVLHWKGRFPRDIEFDLGEEVVEIQNRDVDRRIPLSLEPPHPLQLNKAHNEGGRHGTHNTARPALGLSRA